MGTLLGMKNVRGQLLMHVVGVDQLDALVGYVLHSLLDLLRPVALLAFGIRDAGINPGPDLGETLVLVGHRKLRALPASLCRLEKLKHLRVDNNALRKLPACIGDLHALNTLVAYGNALTGLGPYQ